MPPAAWGQQCLLPGLIPLLSTQHHQFLCLQAVYALGSSGFSKKLTEPQSLPLPLMLDLSACFPKCPGHTAQDSPGTQQAIQSRSTGDGKGGAGSMAEAWRTNPGRPLPLLDSSKGSRCARGWPYPGLAIRLPLATAATQEGGDSVIVTCGC